MKINCIIGIDPGASGGICVWRPNREIETIKMPKELSELKKYLEYIKSIASPFIFIERLSVRPDDITVENGSANMGKMYRIQTMMQGYEQMKAVISVLEIPFVLVAPVKWQTDLKLRIKGRKEEKKDRKKRYKDASSKLYPGVTPTLWNADAILIMHFGRYILRNNVQWVLNALPKQHQNLFD